jgi:hypothetical protein
MLLLGSGGACRVEKRVSEELKSISMSDPVFNTRNEALEFARRARKNLEII